MTRALPWIALLYAQTASAQSEAAPDDGSQTAGDSDGDAELDERARIHFEAGRNHYDAGRYEEAIVEFQASRSLSPRPDLLYNLYLAYERAGQLGEAVSSLEGYLEQRELSESDRTMLEARLGNLRERAARAPEHEPSAAPTSAAAQDASVPVGAITSFSVAGAGAIVFGVFAAVSEAEDQSLSERCGERCPDGEIAALGTYNVIADIGLGVAAAGAIAGIVFLILELAGDDEEAPLATSLDANGVTAGVSF